MESLLANSSSEPSTLDAQITVLCVDDDPDFLGLVESQLSRDGDFEVRTETDPDATIAGLDGVDCVVSDYDMPGRTGVELLADVRERRPSLPFVLCTASSRPDVLASLPESNWTEFIRKGADGETASLLAWRIRRLVTHHRTESVADRLLMAMETSHDGIAITAPDGTFDVVNRVYAARFGYDRDEILGRPWRECYPDSEVERLESTALQTVREDWQWTGGCVGRQKNGDTFTARTRIAGLHDGSLVFCVAGVDGD